MKIAGEESQLNIAQTKVYEQILEGSRSRDSAFPLVNQKGSLVGPYALMVRFPQIGEALQALGTAIRFDTGLSPRVRELAILAVAGRTGSSFEIYAHRLVAIREGLTPVEVTALLEGNYEPTDNTEGAVLDLVDHLMKDTAAYQPYRDYLDEQTIAEVTALVGYYRTLAQLMAQFEIDTPITEPETLLINGVEDVHVDYYKAPGNTPLAVYLHGGGWVAGSRKDHAERFIELERRGISVASLDYRLATESAWPAQLEDILAVYDHFKDDHHAIYLMGASAGATLSALAAFEDRREIAGFIGLFGRYDLAQDSDSVNHPKPNPVMSCQEARLKSSVEGLSYRSRVALLTGVTEDLLSDEVLRDMSPLNRVHTSVPPLLLLHGKNDGIVNYNQSLRLEEKATTAGIACEVMLLPDVNHEDDIFSEALVTDTIATFIHQNSRTQ